MGTLYLLRRGAHKLESHGSLTLSCFHTEGGHGQEKVKARAASIRDSWPTLLNGTQKAFDSSLHSKAAASNSLMTLKVEKNLLSFAFQDLFFCNDATFMKKRKAWRPWKCVPWRHTKAGMCGCYMVWLLKLLLLPWSLELDMAYVMTTMDSRGGRKHVVFSHVNLIRRVEDICHVSRNDKEGCSSSLQGPILVLQVIKSWGPWGIRSNATNAIKTRQE